MQQRKNFIPRNEGFVCEQCAAAVGPAAGTFRNHCPACLTSKHVDGAIPGDRASTCGGLMSAVAVAGSDPDKLDIIHRCLNCEYTRTNKMAVDDSQEALFALINPTLPLALHQLLD